MAAVEPSVDVEGAMQLTKVKGKTGKDIILGVSFHCVMAKAIREARADGSVVESIKAKGMALQGIDETNSYVFKGISVILDEELSAKNKMRCSKKKNTDDCLTSRFGLKIMVEPEEKGFKSCKSDSGSESEDDVKGVDVMIESSSSDSSSEDKTTEKEKKTKADVPTKKSSALPGVVVPPDGLGGGLYGHEIAPSSRSKCFVCDEIILKGKWRLDYAIRESTSLRDKRRLHPACAGGLPMRTKAADINYLDRELSAALPGGLRSALEEAHAALSTSGGAASSSAAG